MRKIFAIILTIVFAIPQFCAFSQDDMELTVKDYIERVLPPQEGRKVTYNEQAKLLTVTDTKSNHRLIRKLIEEFEVGPRQVMIEARFVEVDITDVRELGIEWFARVPGGSQSTKTFSGITVNPSSLPNVSEDVYTTPTYQGVQWDDSTSVTFPKVGERGLDFTISKTTASLKNISERLKALEQLGKANLLSAPKVTTVSGQMANIQVVKIYPYISELTLENIGTAENPIWNYKVTVSEKPIGITLEVTPYVTEGSNTITLDIHPEVSTLKDQVRISNLTPQGTTGEDLPERFVVIGQLLFHIDAQEAGDPVIPTEMGWPVVDVRTTLTSLIIDSGETIVLGGMVKDEETVTKRKIPILGDIPLLGKAFRYEYKNQRKRNLLIFLSASIITADGEVIR